MKKFGFVALIIALNMATYAETIHFSTQEITIHLSSGITASGNSKFDSDNLSIKSHNFAYNFDNSKGTFTGDVIVKNNNAVLSGNKFNVDYQNEHINGNGNIILKTNLLRATSNDLEIKNYEILTLLNNVKVKQNGSQIASNQLIYNLKTDTIISNKRVKLLFKE
jgi:lipopolysaccharide transport protein LptA